MEALREDDGQRLAIAAEAWYLTNLLLLPGIGFGMLWWLYLQHYRSAPPLARCHLAQTVRASFWGAALIVVAAALILGIGGLESLAAWTLALLYLVSIHSAFVLLGVFGLARAMAGKTCRYPLVGVDCLG